MLEVIEAGALTTVQGAGRPALAGLGVPVGGACDRWSLALANSLLGNEPDAAALEMTLAGGTFRALSDCALAVAGAEMEGRLAGDEPRLAGDGPRLAGDGPRLAGDGPRLAGHVPHLASGSALVLRAGQVLVFDSPRDGSGSRTYLALAGGIDVPLVLGSPSTCLVGGFGGLDGRPLRAGDVIRPREPGRMDTGRWDGPPALVGDRLRVVAGPHVEALPAGTLEALLERSFTVSGRGDRQGIRLDGQALDVAASRSLVSQPMAWGAVQLPPDGLPILLLADHQTVGGYPVVAVVIGADLPRLGQLGPGDAVRFEQISPDDARGALAELRAEIGQMNAAASPTGGPR